MHAKELLEDPVLEDELETAVLILAGQLCKKREAAKGRNTNGSDRLMSLPTLP